MGVELTLIQEPELMALDLFGTVLCAQSHVCEPVIEDSCLLRGYHAKARGSCFVMKACVLSCCLSSLLEFGESSPSVNDWSDVRISRVNSKDKFLKTTTTPSPHTLSGIIRPSLAGSQKAETELLSAAWER